MATDELDETPVPEAPAEPSADSAAIAAGEPEDGEWDEAAEAEASADES